jgi:tRNA (guanine37-N1)-methyltransferase
MSAPLHFEVITLFPELFDSFLATSLMGKAVTAGLVRVDRTNPREFGVGRHRSVDDSPYGGGPGMVMRPEPLAAAIEQVEAVRGPCHRVLLSPQGRLFDQRSAEALSRAGRVLLLCGRYEGIDERIPALFAHEILSIGDFVLSGGEVAAQVVIEAACRLVPGVLGKTESTVDESHAAGRLEYPHYTRPPTFRGLSVPDILLSGNHAAIAAWRRKESLVRTQDRRPDLLAKIPPDEGERATLDATRLERGSAALEDPDHHAEATRRGG